MHIHHVLSRFGGIGAPTRGHDHAVKEAESAAKKSGGRVAILMGASSYPLKSKSKEAKKTPVPADERARLAKRFYPDHHIELTKNPIDHLNAVAAAGHTPHLHVDEEQAENFKHKQREGTLSDKVKIHPIKRISHDGKEISGTAQRAHVLAGNKSEFLKNLKPAAPAVHNDAWNTAKKYVREEITFRTLMEKIQQYK